MKINLLTNLFTFQMYVQLDPNIKDMKSFLGDVRTEKTEVCTYKVFFYFGELKCRLDFSYFPLLSNSDNFNQMYT